MRYVGGQVNLGEDRKLYQAGSGGVTNTQRGFNVAYENGQVEAYLNGVRLFPGEDYSYTVSGSGSIITLVSDIGANNVLEVVGFQGRHGGNAVTEYRYVVGVNSGSYTNASTTVFPATVSTGSLVSVFRNGVKLVHTTDFVIDSGASTVTLQSAATANDEITIQVIGPLAHADFVTKENGAFNSGNNTFTMPTTRGTNNYVLTRDDSVGTGGTTWKETLQGPTISGIKYSNQTSGTFAENSGQTATDPAGGDLVQLTGQNFDSTLATPADASNVAISIDGTSATSISVNSAGTEVTFTAPAKSAGSYTLTATNGSGLNANATISYDATPAWVTGSAPSSSLGNFVDGSITGTNGPQIVASEDGSNLTTGYKRVTSESDNTVITTAIAGLTLGDNGYLTGTLAGTNGGDNNFYAVAHDNEGQQSAIRLFKFVSYDYPGNGGATTSTYNIGGTDYVVHVFHHTGSVGSASSAQTFKLIEAKTCDILLVAGGGGAGGMGWSGSHGGGGGGAGGFVYYNQKSLSVGDYSIVVGYGGHGMTSSQDATNGGNSTFTGLTSAVGGGKGGGWDASNNQDGANGGSGGGGGNDTTSGGSGTVNQGNSGGAGAYFTNGSAGGGGGASQAGNTGTAGNGGAGYTEGATVYNWTAGSGTVTFPAYFQNGSSNLAYAGGGGGGSWSNSGPRSGGVGGGGNGANAGNNGSGGDPHTGGGGGGGGDNDGDASTIRNGGVGGTGIVIVRYAI